MISAAEVRMRRVFTGAHVRRPRRRPMPAQQQPNAVRLAYLHALADVMWRARELLHEKLLPQVPALVRAAGVVHDAPGGSDYPVFVGRLVDEASAAFFAEFPTERLTRLAAQFADRTSAQQRAQLARQMKASLGIDLWAEPALGDKVEAWAAANAELVTSVGERYFVDIKNATLQALRTGARADEVAEELQARFAITESRAMLVARDQVGKLHAELNRARQQEVGVEEYVWRTSQDERVRPEHRARDGKTFSWDKPPADGHPGEPINCRCGAEPKLDEILASL